jgi:hypothetical protein
MAYGDSTASLSSASDFEQFFYSQSWILELNAILRTTLKKGRRTIGIGSGHGEHELLLLRDGFDVVASDICIEPLTHTQSLFPQLPILKLDAFTDEPASKYDDILITGMDFYFDDAQVQQLLTQVARWLDPQTPNPRVILTNRYPKNPLTWAIDHVVLPAEAQLKNVHGRMVGSETYFARKLHGYRRDFSDVRRLAAAAGFSVGEVLHASYGSELKRSSVLNRLPRLVDLMVQFDQRWHLTNSANVFELILDSRAQA